MVDYPAFNPEPLENCGAENPDSAEYPAVDIDWNWRPMPIDPSLLSDPTTFEGRN